MREIKGNVQSPVGLEPEGERVTLPDLGDAAGQPITLGHFQLGEHLGSGGMGAVYKARDLALDRAVAIKLLRSDAGGEKARARLLREAQALAQLKHRNVVTIFEVGVAGEEVFIAMELVAGGTLREWMKTPHGWREIADCFLAVSRGLAAAHAQGLVHRDVKPSNIFIDLDGSPKLGDFGLVSAAGEQEAGEVGRGSPQPASGLTTAGKVMGTPAYMPLEQQRGQPADARADQYAFCVSLHEALTGKLPTQEGVGSPVPRRLRSILSRGLKPDAGARYPSMDALLKDLARARRGRRLLWAGLAGLLAVAGAGWTVARRSELCRPPTARLDAAWGSRRREAVRLHLLAIDPAQGQARFASAAAWLDPLVQGLGGQYEEACRATRVRRTQSETLLDLRMRCIDGRLTELGESASILASVKSAGALDGAVAGAARLSPLEACSDVAALTLAAPPPKTPEGRAKAEALARRIEQVNVREQSGDLKDLPADAGALLVEARALDHPPTLANALAVLARVQMGTGAHEAAEALLREAAQVAARAHDDATEAFAWTKLIKILAWDLLKPDQAIALFPVATAAVARAGDSPDLRVDLLFAQADALAAGPRAKEALQLYQQAREILEGAGAGQQGSRLAPRLAEVALSTGGALWSLGENQRAIAEYQRAIESFRRLYGPDSVDEAYAWHNQGECLRVDGKPEAALEAYEHAVRIREQRLGDSPLLAADILGVGTALNDLKRWGEALAADERALQIGRAHAGADAPSLLPAMIARSQVLVHLERTDEALKGFDEVIALMERARLTTINLAITVYSRAELRVGMGRYRDAIQGYIRAVSLFEEQRGKEHGVLLYPLVGEGRALVLAGQPAAAMAPLRRALSLKPMGGADSLLAQAHFYLARAQFETGQDRSRTRRGAAVARAAAAAAGAQAELLQEMDRWLSAHR